MIVYIPINSNDFNSVFTTLSISPLCFYANRKYSFKRATTNLLNENEFYLVGYEKPIFHNKEFDNDFGYPVLIEIDIGKSESEWQITSSGIKYILFDNTIFLLNNFKLLFRIEKEMNEIFSRTIKSIETKYVSLARQNSHIVKEDCFVSEIPALKFPIVKNNINSLIFQKERKLNRLLGAILGSSIAYVNRITKEWQEISILLRVLNNSLSLYLNKISENNDFEKKQVLEIVEKVLKIHEKIEKLEEAIMLGSNSSFTTEFFNNLKQSRIFNIPVFNLLIEGLLVSSKVELPTSLKLEKLKRAINLKYNSKYPNAYIEKVINLFSDVRNKCEEEINHQRKNNKLTLDTIVRVRFIYNTLEISLPEGLLENEKIYLIHCLIFFIENDNIPDIETFFTDRKQILTDLAIHLKNSVEQFAGSKERDYIASLLTSFDTLRDGFDVSESSNEVLKSIAILFTTGRELHRYIEICEREGIKNTLIYYTIWGSIYGAATLPKTMTESITDNRSNIELLISVFAVTISEYQNYNPQRNLEYITLNSEVDQENNEQIKVQLNSTKINSLIEQSEKALNKISVLESKILENLQSKEKVKLVDLKYLSKSFKTINDIKDIINNKLNEKIKLTKKDRIWYAELINTS